MLEAKRLSFIGCGNMGEALLRRLLESNAAEAGNVSIAVRSPERQAYLEVNYGIKGVSLDDVAQDVDIILLAVKPQQLADLPVLAVQPGTIVVSVLAGTTIEKLAPHFPGAQIARAMPNLGYAVGRSVTGLFFDNSITWQPPQQALVRQMLETGGVAIEVDQEEKMNSITAAAGSGPAYFFWFTERIAESAQKLGFSEDDAQQIAREVFIGAAEVVKTHPDVTLGEWRERVTSKGGTTEAALNVFNTSDIATTIHRALQAAHNRSSELSK